MSRKCELSGVSVLHGNKVSHSQRKTRRRFKPNLKVVRFASNITGQKYRFLINTRCIRSIEKIGDFDTYMLKTSSDVLSYRAQIVKRKIVKRKLVLRHENWDTPKIQKI